MRVGQRMSRVPLHECPGQRQHRESGSGRSPVLQQCGSHPGSPPTPSRLSSGEWSTIAVGGQRPRHGASRRCRRSRIREPSGVTAMTGSNRRGRTTPPPRRAVESPRGESSAPLTHTSTPLLVRQKGGMCRQERHEETVDWCWRALVKDQNAATHRLRIRRRARIGCYGDPAAVAREDDRRAEGPGAVRASRSPSAGPTGSSTCGSRLPLPVLVPMASLAPSGLISTCARCPCVTSITVFPDGISSTFVLPPRTHRGDGTATRGGRIARPKYGGRIRLLSAIEIEAIRAARHRVPHANRAVD